MVMTEMTTFLMNRLFLFSILNIAKMHMKKRQTTIGNIKAKNVLLKYSESFIIRNSKSDMKHSNERIVSVLRANDFKGTNTEYIF